MDRTFGKLPKAPIPAFWVIVATYLLIPSMLVIGPWLIGYRGYCERYSALEFVNIAVHAILIFSCAVYVAIYRRRIGWVMAPLLLVAILSAAFILNAQSGYPRMAGDICLVAY